MRSVEPVAERSRFAAIALCAVAAATAIYFAIARPTLAAGWAMVPLACVLMFAMVPVLIDERSRRLPNEYSLALFGLGVILGVIASYQAGSFAPLLAELAAGAAVGLLYFVIAVVGGCGMGDVKFAAALVVTVAYFGGILAVYVAILALVVSAIRGVVRLARGLRSQHPHGASLVAGAAVVGAVAVMLGS